MLKQHLTVTHQHWINNIDMVIHGCEGPIQTEQPCVFCGAAYLPLALRGHLARHMQDIALFALPRVMDGEEAKTMNSDQVQLSLADMDDLDTSLGEIDDDNPLATPDGSVRSRSPVGTGDLEATESLGLAFSTTHRDPISGLWTEAYNNLPNEYKSDLVDQLQWDFHQLLQRLLETASQAQQQCLLHQSRVVWEGKDVDMRVKTEKLILWITKFKEIVDITAQFDPVHDVLSWAAMESILKVCKATFIVCISRNNSLLSNSCIFRIPCSSFRD